MCLEFCTILSFIITLVESDICAFGKMSFSSLLCISFIKAKCRYHVNDL